MRCSVGKQNERTKRRAKHIRPIGCLVDCHSEGMQGLRREQESLHGSLSRRSSLYLMFDLTTSDLKGRGECMSRFSREAVFEPSVVVLVFLNRDKAVEIVQTTPTR